MLELLEMWEAQCEEGYEGSEVHNPEEWEEF